MKTKAELLTYAIKMRRRGDTYYAVEKYLLRNEEKDTIRQHVLQELQILEKKGSVKDETIQPRKTLHLNLILGTLLIGSGLTLMVFLWGKGLVSTIPLIIIGAGILAVTGVLK